MDIMTNNRDISNKDQVLEISRNDGARFDVTQVRPNY